MFKVLVLQASHSLSDERTEFLIKDRLSFMRFLGLDLADPVPDANTIWTFREALTRAGIDGKPAIEVLFRSYEQALTRTDARSGQAYDSSAHLPWIGERTRDPGGAHVEFARQIRNPVAVKIGPAVSTQDVLALIKALDPDCEPGRLTLITRMGAGRIRQALPPLAEAVAASGAPVVWVCDPMHGNTVETASGHKTRYFDDVLDEVAGFFEVHRALGTHPGGIHIEFTGDDVTECIGGGQHIAEADLRQRYETACDPRLNRSQSLDLAFRVADLYRSSSRP